MHNCLEYHQDSYHAQIFNRQWYVSGITHPLIGVAIFLKVKIQPVFVFDYTDGEICC